jgi:hypothetical protein
MRRFTGDMTLRNALSARAVAISAFAAKPWTLWPIFRIGAVILSTAVNIDGILRAAIVLFI